MHPLVHPLAQESTSLPGGTIAGFLVGALLLYGFGYAMAVMRRANADYKATKAAVPKLRKGFWLAWWAAMKAGFWIGLIICCFIVWFVYRD